LAQVGVEQDELPCWIYLEIFNRSHGGVTCLAAGSMKDERPTVGARARVHRLSWAPPIGENEGASAAEFPEWRLAPLEQAMRVPGMTSRDCPYGPYRDRTCDLEIKSLLLYQLS
jgi:hypothetical protein